MPRKGLPNSTTVYVLKALIPYTEANLKLAFKPNLFFNDLEKISQINSVTAKSAFYRARKSGLVKIDSDGCPTLTPQGLRKLQPFIAKKLQKDAKLLVIFDIPEEQAWKRRHLRDLLRELNFVQIQKSVWQSSFDSRRYIAAEVKKLHLQPYVQIYEAARLSIK